MWAGKLGEKEIKKGREKEPRGIKWEKNIQESPGTKKKRWGCIFLFCFLGGSLRASSQTIPRGS